MTKTVISVSTRIYKSCHSEQFIKSSKPQFEFYEMSWRALQQMSSCCRMVKSPSYIAFEIQQGLNHIVVFVGDHYSDVIMGAMASPASQMFTQPFIQAQIKKKHQSFTGLCARNSPVTGQFPKASNTENVFIWWRHRVIEIPDCIKTMGLPDDTVWYKTTLHITTWALL